MLDQFTHNQISGHEHVNVMGKKTVESCEQIKGMSVNNNPIITKKQCSIVGHKTTRTILKPILSEVITIRIFP